MKTGFMKIPLEFSSRTDITPATKLVVGYIFTRSNVKKDEWFLIASNVAENTGLSDKTLNRAFKQLNAAGVIHYEGSERVNPKAFPSKIYSINKERLNEYMKSTDVILSKAPLSSCPSTSDNLSADRRTKRQLQEDPAYNKKLQEDSIKQEEPENPNGETKTSEFSPAVRKFLNQSPQEQVAWLERTEANKTLSDDLKCGKDVLETGQFAEAFANW